MCPHKIFPHEHRKHDDQLLPEALYHYTNHEAFTKILEGRQIWAHDSRLSNDRRETSYALGLMTRALDEVSEDAGYNEYISRILEIFRDPFDPHKLRETSRYIFIASFSEEPNLLSQWRAYASENGYSIGFDAKKLRIAAELSGFSFGKVEYGFEESVALFARHLRSYLRQCIVHVNADEPLVDCVERFGLFLGTTVPLVKHESFAEEKEWRAFRSADRSEDTKFYSGRRSLVPYQPISLSPDGDPIALKRVLIGPSDDHHALVTWTSDYLNGIGYKTRHGPKGTGVHLQVSGSPYRLKR